MIYNEMDKHLNKLDALKQKILVWNQYSCKLYATITFQDHKGEMEYGDPLQIIAFQYPFLENTTAVCLCVTTLERVWSSSEKEATRKKSTTGWMVCCNVETIEKQFDILDEVG